MTSLFDINNLKEGWQAVLKKREFNKRLWILLLIAAFELEIFMDNGKRGNSYLYFRRQLGWGEVEFSRFENCRELSITESNAVSRN